MPDINVTVGSNVINATIAQGAGTYVNGDAWLRLNGAAENTGFRYVTATGKIEVWISGTQQAEWGT